MKRAIEKFLRRIFFGKPEIRPVKPVVHREYHPKPGMAWNPLTSFPKNSPCVCGSKIKFKKCHGPRIMTAVPIEVAEEIRANWDLLRLGKKTLKLKGEMK